MVSRSKRFQFDEVDRRKLAISFALGATGFLSAWTATELVPTLEEQGSTFALLLAAVVPVLVNIIRKWLTDNSDNDIAAPHNGRDMDVPNDN